MANAEHLARLKEGVYAWNAWCAEHPALRPDLSAADLSAAILRHAVLISADLNTALQLHIKADQ